MKTVIQRVSRAEVRVDGEVVGKIGRGVVALVGVERGDGIADAHMTARKLAGLRIFPGAQPPDPESGGSEAPAQRRAGKMDRNLLEIGGEALVISQFTLAGDIRKGRRPSFNRAEDPERAEELYMAVAEELRVRGIPTATGRFAASMEVELVNEGPVTLMIFCEGGVIL